MGRREQLLDTKVYSVYGEDVASVLYLMGRGDLVDDLYEFERVVDYVYTEMNIPLQIYLADVLTKYMNK